MTNEQIHEYRKRAQKERDALDYEAMSLLTRDPIGVMMGNKKADAERFAWLAQRAHTLDYVIELFTKMPRT